MNSLPISVRRPTFSISRGIERLEPRRLFSSLISVAYGGPGFHEVIPDPNPVDQIAKPPANGYGPQQWLDKNYDHIIETSQGDHDWPISVTINTAITADVVIHDPCVKASTAEVRGVDKDGDVIFAAGPAKADGKDDIETASPLSSGDNKLFPFTGQDTPLVVEWQVKAACGSWEDSGTSTNVAYVLWGKPIGGVKLYQTVLYTATQTNGESTDTVGEVVNEVFNDFVGEHATNWKGTPMTYWGAHSHTGYQPDYFTTQGLLNWHDGRCNAWANLLHDALAAEGIKSYVDVIDPSKVGLPTTYSVGSKVYNFANVTGFAVNAHGQNNPSSATSFSNHAVVQLTQYATSEILDPSYGKTYLTSGTGKSQVSALDNWLTSAVVSVAADYVYGSSATFVPVSFREGQILPGTKKKVHLHVTMDGTTVGI